MEAARWINSRISLVGGIYLSSGNSSILNPCNFFIKTFDPLCVSFFCFGGGDLALNDGDCGPEDFFTEFFFILCEDLDILGLADKEFLREDELPDAFFFF